MINKRNQLCRLDVRQVLHEILTEALSEILRLADVDNHTVTVKHAVHAALMRYRCQEGFTVKTHVVSVPAVKTYP